LDYQQKSRCLYIVRRNRGCSFQRGRDLPAAKLRSNDLQLNCVPFVRGQQREDILCSGCIPRGSQQWSNAREELARLILATLGKHCTASLSQRGERLCLFLWGG
jgi:hypothetical protein